MEYTVQKLASLAGISSRTLRYYDQCGLLSPARINSSGYRIYGTEQVDRLQQILFYKALGMELADIQSILDNPSFDAFTAMEEHLQKLLLKQKEIELLIQNATSSLCAMRGELTMKNEEKFEGFKKQLIDENEKKYGKEIREKYGEDAINESNRKMMNMTEEQYGQFQKLGEELNQALIAGVEEGIPSSELGKKVAKLHKDWLSFTWKEYSKQAHIGLAQMYVDDERFTAYYEKIAPGAAAYLCEAIKQYCKE